MIRNTTQRDFKLKYVVLKWIDLFGESCYFIIINELMILLKKEFNLIFIQFFVCSYFFYITKKTYK